MNAVAKEVTAKVAKEVEKVTMKDGREVEFVGKRKLLKEPIIEGTNVSVRFDFRNGETLTFASPPSLVPQFIAHGISQKIGDETAGVEDVDDMFLFVSELADTLNKGEWSTRVAGSGVAGTSVLLRALVEVTGRTIDQVKTFLTGKSQAEKMALRNSPKIKPTVDKLEAEKVAKASKIDTDALLATL
jgi:hypothetical protein